MTKPKVTLNMEDLRKMTYRPYPPYPPKPSQPSIAVPLAILTAESDDIWDEDFIFNVPEHFFM